MKASGDKSSKILMTLVEVERNYTSTPFVSAVFAAFVLYLSYESPAETEIGNILKANRVSDSLCRAILGRLGNHWEEYRPLLSAFSQSELGRFIGTAVNGESVFGGRASECASSLPIVDLVIRLLDLKPGDSVCDLGCAAGDFLLRAYSSTSLNAVASRWVGMEVSADAAAIAQIRMFCAGAKVEIRNESVFGKTALSRRFDKVFCDPPIGLRGLPRESEVREFLKEAFPDFPALMPSMSGDWIFAARAAAALKSGGRAVVVLLPSALSDLRGAAFRRYFIRRNLIEAVIELPSKLFSHTTVPVCMVVLGEGHETIKMIRAGDLATPNRRKNVLGDEHVATIAACLESAAPSETDGLDRHLVTVRKDELLSGDCYLDPRLYFAKPVAVPDAVSLGSLIESPKRGATIASHELDKLACKEDTPILYVSSGDITDGILAARLTNLREIPKAYKACCAKEGDIVVSRVLSSGAGFKSAVIDTPSGKTVLPSGNLLVVSVKRDKTDPYFIKACFDSAFGQDYLAGGARGTSVVTLGPRFLEEFPVPALPLSRQREIGKVCRSKAKRLAELRDQLARAKAELVGVLADQAPDCFAETAE